MDFVSPTPVSLLWLPVAVILFLVPGWMLAKRWPTPVPLVTAFLGSAVILFHLVLLIDATGLPLHAGTLMIGLVLPAVALGWFARRSRVLLAHPRSTAFVPTSLLWLVPPLFALASIATRAVLDPLSGYDNGFRWDYLARLFLFNGSLRGYPPITASDFELYSWCDGIPPLAPLLNLWIYARTGSIAPVLTSVRVIGEALVLGTVVFRYSRLLWGEPAGWAALAALSTSALALWSVAMGQETGLTALSLVTMLYFLELNTREPRTALACWAAVAAAIGALSREYGLVFALVGLVVLLLNPATRPAWPWFAVTAAALTIPWYARNALITGNPLYPQTLGGLFPGNAVHDESLRYFLDYWSLDAGIFDPAFIPKFLAALCGVLVLAALVGTCRLRRRALALVSGVAVIILIWAWLILPQAGAGWVYSARALSPALALLAVLAGWIGTLRGRAQIFCALLACIASVDAARRAWLLPLNSTASPWSFSFAAWRSERDLLQRVSANPVWAMLALAAAGKGVGVDHPMSHALLTMRGGRAVPLFSPLLTPTFDSRPDFATALQQLRAADIKFLTLSNINPVTQNLMKAHPFWTTLRSRYRPNAEVGPLEIYELERLTPAAPP